MLKDVGARTTFLPNLGCKAFTIIILSTILFLLLFVDTSIIIRQLHKNAETTPEIPASERVYHSTYNPPDIVIYRRTKKTGSTSMLAALLELTEPLGYFALPLVRPTDRQHDLIRQEAIRQPPRKVIVLEHNRLTRRDVPGRNVIIIDTIRDGFEQVTSYCRYVQKVKGCSEELEDCLKGDAARSQIEYRWAEDTWENADNYIDFPLSSRHPALSTTALRTVFPNATLNIKNYNVVGSACNKTEKLETVYKQIYQKLDTQLQMLGRRLLTISGYYTLGSLGSDLRNASIWEFLDASEEAERRKYGQAFEESRAISTVSGAHRAMWKEGNSRHWEWRDGKLVWVVRES